MMIAADHIVIDGDTACVVEWAAPDSPSGWPANRNLRPCDTCGGDQIVPVGYINYDTNEPVEVMDCPDCDGTGRHTFTVEVCDCYHICEGECAHKSLRVHVLDVLPIFGDHDEAMDAKRFSYHVVGEDGLPSAAVPGMWAIRLEIHR